MLLPNPLQYRRKRKLPDAPAEAPAVPLALVSASFDPGVPAVTLGFDRPVDASGLNGALIIVDDGAASGMKFDGGGGVTVLGPATVRIDLVDIGGSAYPDVRLTAGSGNGIVAVGDGAEWAGVSALVLPFP